jgi:hypothetical protein
MGILLDIISSADDIIDMTDITPLPIKKLIPFSRDTARRIADYRFEQRLPSECAAVRRLVDLALDLAAAQQPQEASR